MKKALLNIGSLFLAVLVLLSTFSFTVETHLCSGEVADYSFTGNLERCQMPSADHNDKQDAFLNKIPCCQDIIETIERSNDELTVAKELDVQQLFVVAFVVSHLDFFEGASQKKVPFQNYEPPLVTKDIQVLYDTFLI